MKKSLLVALTTLMILVSPALAQQEKGDTELQLQGSLSLGISGDTEDFGSIFVNWGRFVTDRHELGLSVAAFFDSDGDIFGVGGPFWRFNFTTGKKAVPYVGFAAFTDFGDFSSGDVVGNVELGSRWFLSRQTAFTMAGSLLYDFDENDFGDNLQVLFGFTHFWSKK